jgi:hypothetical protein
MAPAGGKVSYQVYLESGDGRSGPVAEGGSGADRPNPQLHATGKATSAAFGLIPASILSGTVLRVGLRAPTLVTPARTQLGSWRRRAYQMIAWVAPSPIRVAFFPAW